jgi:hypothetical protein
MNIQSNIKPTLGLGILIVITLAVIGLFREEPTKIRIDPNQVLTVNQIGSNPDQFQGRLKVKGTVSEVFTEKSIFALGELSPKKTVEQKNDEKKRDCATNKKKGCCPSPRIPIKYEGPLPKLQDNVLVEGKIVNNEDGKKYFQAEKITNL